MRMMSQQIQNTNKRDTKKKKQDQTNSGVEKYNN